MEEELVVDFCMCGYLIFQDIWEAAIGKEIPRIQRQTCCSRTFIHVFTSPVKFSPQQS